MLFRMFPSETSSAHAILFSDIGQQGSRANPVVAILSTLFSRSDHIVGLVSSCPTQGKTNLESESLDKSHGN